MDNIGILGIQGDYEKHAQAIRRLGYNPLLVKKAATLDVCSHLIIPGGESTTFMNLIERLGLREPLINFAKEKPVFGTCAGLIILSTDVNDSRFTPLGLIDLVVERNAYGRQIDSFTDNIILSLNNHKEDFRAVFIRAPKIIAVKGSSRAIAYHGKDIVMAANNNILVATFHPELTEDNRIHDYFLNQFGKY